MTFAQVLVGGVHETDTISFGLFGTTVTSSTTLNGFSIAGGGGLDVGIWPWFAIRAVEVEYSFNHVATEKLNGVRVGTGVVFRFGK